jgi:hypothetical protein
MKNLSLLQRVNSTDIQQFPFPHIILENALPEELHSELRESFPSPRELGVDPSQDNVRWSTKARDLSQLSAVSELWKLFINYHSSHQFWDDVVRVFGEAICSKYPDHFPSLQELSRLGVQVRNLDSANREILELDAQVSGNTPAITPGVPRGVHVDAPNALYAGLYYLRHSDDRSDGGDLQLWQWRDNYSYQKKSYFYKEGVEARHIRLLNTVNYRSNTLVFIINSLDSLHSVTERKPTTSTRQFVNLVCDTPGPLFDLEPYMHQRVLKFAKRRLHQSRLTNLFSTPTQR